MASLQIFKILIPLREELDRNVPQKIHLNGWEKVFLCYLKIWECFDLMTQKSVDSSY